MNVVLIGVVTGLAGLSVGGVKVDLDRANVVTRDAQAASARALALGEFVEVRALEDGHKLRALSVAILDAAIGRVTAADRSAGTIDVLGQRIRMQASTVFAPGLSRERVAAARPGEHFRVSGLRAPDGSIVATRIERAPSRAGPMLSGLPGEPQPGERFVVEGYVAGNPRSGQFSIGGLAFGVDPGAGGNLGPNRLVRASGRTEADGRRVVERADLLPAPFSAPASEGRPGRPVERPQRGEIGGR